MGFFDNLSRKLGFTEVDDERDEELDEDEIEEEEDDDEEAGGFRLPLSNPFRNRARQRVEYDEEPEEEEQPEPQPRNRKQPKNNVIRDARMDVRTDARTVQEVDYTHCERIINVRQIEECGEIIQCLLHGDSILLNLENVEPKDCGRVVDLLSGAAFALSGRMIKVAHLSYLLAPEHVRVIEEDIYASTGMNYGRQR